MHIDGAVDRINFELGTGIHQGMLEIGIEEVLWSIWGSYLTIWSSSLTNAKWNSVAWPNTMTTLPQIRLYTNPWPFYWTWRFTELWEVSIQHLRTGVACRQGTLTPPDTWSRPIWDLHMFYLLRPILFLKIVVIFPDYAIRLSLGTFRFCFEHFY